MARKRHRTQHPGVYYRLVNEDRPDGGRRYIVMYKDGTGCLRSETLPEGATLEDARAHKAQLTVRRAKGELLVRKRVTVGELLDQWLEQRRPGLNPKTVESYEWAIETHLKKHLGHFKVHELSTSEVARMISKLKRDGMKTWSVKKVLTPLKGAYGVAVREGWVSACPTASLLPHERPKDDQREMRCLSRREIEKVLGHATSDRWRALFATLIFTGLRVGEALSLTWDDVDLEQGLVDVRASKTKAGVRKVILIPRVATMLRRHKLQQAPGASRVFSTLVGKPLARRDALRALREAEGKAGIPDYTLHELRHTFASILIAQGELPTLVARQMGHKDPGVTMSTYAHLFEAQESVDRARERLQEAFGGVL